MTGERQQYGLAGELGALLYAPLELASLQSPPSLYSKKLFGPISIAATKVSDNPNITIAARTLASQVKSPPRPAYCVRYRSLRSQDLHSLMRRRNTRIRAFSR